MPARIVNEGGFRADAPAAPWEMLHLFFGIAAQEGWGLSNFGASDAIPSGSVI